MELIAFTTYGDVRTTLGVTSDELTDADLGLEVYLYNLESTLNAISPTLLPAYVAASTATAGASETALQKALYRATRLFAVASVSLAVAYSLPMRALKSLTDGKAGASRFSEAPYKDTIQNLVSQTLDAKIALEDAFADFNGVTVQAIKIPSFMAVVTPTLDPVTG